MAKNDREIPDNREGPRSFTVFYQDVADGDFQRDASEELFALTGALRDEALRVNGKVKGEITIKLNISIDPRGVIGVDQDIKTKKPKIRRATAQAWITAGGNITLQHPRQLTLPVREVRTENDDVKEVDAQKRAPREV
jgi:hypothetical protein